MSIPPQLIRVKRKRDNESPVTFLQLDEGTKRHRSRNNWVYQRRESTVPASNAPAVSRHDAKPVIHVSKPGDDSRQDHTEGPGQPAANTPTIQTTDTQHAEQRKFHVSRAMLSQAASGPGAAAGISKQVRLGPTVFIERSRKKIVPKSSRQGLAAQHARASVDLNAALEPKNGPVEAVDERRLKKPGVAKRSRDGSRDASREASQDPTSRNPLPPSVTNRHTQDMDMIVADMNQWVLNEIGATLHSMEQEKKQAEKPKFRPKAPEKRYQDRHPQPLVPSPQVKEGADTPMADASEEEGDGDDWIIEEYVRIPAHSMAVDISPSDIGILVLDGEKENQLFYGSPQDEDEDLDEDDEDENAENHYTADYPEDEVDSDDEFGRQAYMFRNGNASDDEEFDDDEYNEDSDDMLMEGDDDDDARMDRIREFMKRTSARQ
ncbi:hypothetical protein PT974_08489 [Cladobotryum mycophilum]|uniref:Transcription factor Iwr1 domain-containing protein n=1 Tax=Cladobotryum mycophilum TaxID=491253 RepID=A0ABR0SDI2_9HYPO